MCLMHKTTVEWCLPDSERPPSLGAPSAICTAELQRLADCLRHNAEAVQISALPSCRDCLTASAVCLTASAICLGHVPDLSASPIWLTAS